jgi:oligopeptidase B
MTARRIRLACILGSLVFSAPGFVSGQSLDPSAATPPVAKKIPKTIALHGETRVDDYFWLREKSNPEVISYLNAENAYADAVLKPTVPLQETLYKEMLGRIKQTDDSVPARRGDYWYYSRTEQGKQYPIQCRKHKTLDAKEEVTLDLNELAKGQKFLSLGVYSVSDDHHLLAYSADVTGFREYTLYVKDLRTGQLLPDKISKVQMAVWGADNQTLFYVVEDAAKRPHRLYRHKLGATEDPLVYEEKDALYTLRAGRSRDRKYVWVESESSTTAECRYIPADEPGAPPRLVLPREEGHRYDVDHRDGLFYIRTDKDAKNYRLVTAPVEDPAPKNWKEMIGHRPDILLEGVWLFSNHAVISECEAGLDRLRVFDLRTGQSHGIEVPEAVYAIHPDANPEFQTATLRYRYESFVTPDSVYDYDMEKRDRKLLKQTEVHGHDPSRYTSERIMATATDGAQVPISLAYKKGLVKDGTAPMLLYGYGSYGASMTPHFDSDIFSLLDRGVVYAVAHIRGGREMGEAWHDQGKMLNKKNTFTDFIACADHLVNQKYASRDRLAIQGGSAGGLLIGAVVNLRPDVCKAAVLHVPFVDVINTMLDESLPLTIQEFLEWGNPNVPNEYQYMKSYCPYSNISATKYPAMLVRTSLNDSQVMYWEPAKYVAKLRTLKTDNNPLVFTINMAAGHGGHSGRYDRLKEEALTYAFILWQMGITK